MIVVIQEGEQKKGEHIVGITRQTRIKQNYLVTEVSRTSTYRIGLSQHDAVQVALRLGMSNQVQAHHFSRIRLGHAFCLYAVCYYSCMALGKTLGEQQQRIQDK